VTAAGVASGLESHLVALHRQRGFRRLWIGEGVSVFGNATTSVLIPLLAVVGLHASAWWMGLLTAATWLPWLVIGLPVGALVDGLPVRAVMIAADVVSAVALASVPVAWWCGVLTLGQLLAVALAGGCATVFFRSAYPSLVRQVVARDQLTEANARLFGTESAANVAGPGLGGFLAGVVGAAAGVLVDAASFVVSALCLWRLPMRPPATTPRERPRALRSRIREGLRFVYTDRLLRYFTVSGGISNFGLTGFQAILVLYLVRSGGLTPATIGLVLAINGIGGVVGAAAAARLAARLGSGRATVVLRLVAGPTSLALVFAGPGARVALVAAALAVLAFGVVAGNVIKSAFRMRYVPGELQGRSVTAMQLVNFGMAPLAAVCAGWLGGAIGLRATVGVMAAIHAAACLSVLCSPVMGRRDLPERAETRDAAVRGAAA
jgi:predicted MFS family arabinose efflux permease